MSRPTPWRVRVIQITEGWVEVSALTGNEAEAAAQNIPGVVSVFAKSAIPGNKLAVRQQPVGVEDEEEN